MRDYSKEHDIDLVITGIRRAEGGRRATKITNCYLPEKYSPYAMYFPLFWWSNEDKSRFIKENNIKLSDCYEVYGMSRTGCIGCPFGRKLDEELDILEKYEPKLHKIATTIFAKTYDATKEYRTFVKEKLPLDKKKKV
jgi:3'-phosphoadenosine 5'-phosphosulfate sulfotransferase (PAPS reductase)/FAD synthetase